MCRSQLDDRWFSHPDFGERPSRACIAEARRAEARGKSELRRAVRRVTPGQGNLTDSGTENIPPAFARSARFGVAGPMGLLRRSPEGRRRVRVKRCGKSAP